jgi:hypothetical protein
MTETRSTGDSRTGYRDPDAPTGWVGWILFAGMMLILVGTFQFIAGLVALFNDDYYLVTSNNLVVHMDYTAWGWVHLGLGALSMAAGYGVMAGKSWARVYAIAFAFLAAVANLAFLSAYPVWGVILITLDVLVIWALTVHGKEVRHYD